MSEQFVLIIFGSIFTLFQGLFLLVLKDLRDDIRGVAKAFNLHLHDHATGQF